MCTGKQPGLRPLAPGTTINGTSGTFTGGDENKTYRWSVQYTVLLVVTGLTKLGLHLNVIRSFLLFDLPGDAYNYQVQIQDRKE